MFKICTMYNVYIVIAVMRDGGMIRQLPYLSDTSKQMQLLITMETIFYP